MNTVIVWILVAVSGGHTSPNTIATFESKNDCQYVANQLYLKSKDQRGSSYIYGFCVDARVIK